jgi:hypothetical protein
MGEACSTHEGNIHTHTILVEKPEGITCETCRREGNIKKAIDVNWIHLTSTPEAHVV